MIQKILVEGPDCSGKSTLVDRLKNELGWDARHLHHQKGDQFSRYLREYANASRVVFARGHISELVYSQLWRGGNPFKENELKILNDLIEEKFIVILAYPILEVIKKRYSDRDYSQQIELEELKRSRELFLKEIEVLEPIRYYSKSYEELDSLIKDIKKELK